MANYVLEILDGDRAGEVLPVGDSTIRIGRKAGNDIVLTDEKTSGVHCEILPEGDRLVLKDLGSTNGTFLDGKRISELVLTPGDVVTIGRTKVIFRLDGEVGGAADADAGEFALRTLDSGRLKKRGSSIGLLAVLVVVLAGAGGWYWWQGQQQDIGATAGPKVDSKPLAVVGNRLDAGVASCESDEGWTLRVAGLGFRSGGQAHTGKGSLTAYRGEEIADTEGAAAVPPKSDDDYAVLQLSTAMDVFTGRTLTVAAHFKTVGGAQIALHAKVTASNEDVPFRFCNGTKMAAFEDGWQRVEAMVTVPSGCDRLTVEVVAVLPNQDSEAMVDDVAVLEGGSANGIEVQLTEAGQTAFGFGSSLAVRSTDTNNPSTVLMVLPDQVPAAMTKLHKAGFCVLSDLGASLNCTVADAGFELAASNVQTMQVVMPVEAAGGVMVAAEDTFAPASAQSEFEARKVLFGSFATRAMLQFEAPTSVRGETGGGFYRLHVNSPQLQLMVGFRSELGQAREFVRKAQAARSEGRPGDAMDELAKLFASVPMDSESLQLAQQMRAELLNEQANRITELRQDLDEADFFTTRGGFDRVVSGVDQLISLYGEHNMEDLAGAQALRAKASQRLAALDAAVYEVQRKRLLDLADAFASAQQPELQKIVSDYITRHLPNGK